MRSNNRAPRFLCHPPPSLFCRASPQLKHTCATTDTQIITVLHPSDVGSAFTTFVNRSRNRPFPHKLYKHYGAIPTLAPFDFCGWGKDRIICRFTGMGDMGSCVLVVGSYVSQPPPHLPFCCFVVFCFFVFFVSPIS